MNTQQIINTFEFTYNSGNGLQAEIYALLKCLKVVTETCQRSYPQRQVHVLQVFENNKGVTPEEFLDFMGYSHEDHQWRGPDGMLCGIEIINGVLERAVYYGGFNGNKPALYRVYAISKRTGDKLVVPALPNAYSLDDEIRESVKKKLTKMGL